MIPKSYYDNMNGKNILSDYTPKDMSTDSLNNFIDSSLENMVINSNLDNSNVIKWLFLINIIWYINIKFTILGGTYG